jgi:5-methylcytosine-specific restriction endonuclease McrA
MTRRSLLSPSRPELAALISMTMGREAARTFRAGNRHVDRPNRAAVADSAWHPVTQLSRGTSSENLRGSAEDRRRRKRYLLDAWGNGTAAPCAFCKIELTYETLTVDRYPIPGRKGGRYTRDNIRPACGPCNSEDQGRQAALALTGADT